MNSGGSFKIYKLVALLDLHGPELTFESDGPDAEHAHECIEAIMNGETTELTTADDELLRSQGRYRRQIIADLPPPASARWLAWLRDDPTRVLPWKDQPLPPDHKNPYPYTQARGGLTFGEIMRGLGSLSDEERSRAERMGPRETEEYLCSPPEVRRKKLAALKYPGTTA